MGNTSKDWSAHENAFSAYVPRLPFLAKIKKKQKKDLPIGKTKLY
jgi:hypothetical protein